jgi:hypothetical protein
LAIRAKENSPSAATWRPAARALREEKRTLAAGNDGFQHNGVPRAHGLAEFDLVHAGEKRRFALELVAQQHRAVLPIISHSTTPARGCRKMPCKNHSSPRTV